MKTMIARCCGLDVHTASVRACVRLLVDGVVRELIETFGHDDVGFAGAARLAGGV